MWNQHRAGDPVGGQSVTTAALPGRTLDFSTAVVVIVGLQAATVLTIVALAGRYGAPRAWPRAAWCGAIASAALAAIVVWWINKPLEGATVVPLSSKHGIAVGDLLSVPFLAAAIALVVVRYAPAKR
jgi:uncharacterized iron-regulated membrane protein